VAFGHAVVQRAVIATHQVAATGAAHHEAGGHGTKMRGRGVGGRLKSRVAVCRAGAGRMMLGLGCNTKHWRSMRSTGGIDREGFGKETMGPFLTGRQRDDATAAVVSSPSNITEGVPRRIGNDRYRFHEYAQGSAFELQTRVLVVMRRK